MIIFTLKAIFIAVLILTTARMLYLQIKARKHLKAEKIHTFGDKMLTRYTALPPEEYLTDKGKRLSREAHFFAWVAQAMLFILIIYQLMY
jgi:hypothetical protein